MGTAASDCLQRILLPVKNKIQHYIPSSYLRPWCDPSTPCGHTPYVWLFDRDGSNPRKKAPASIFAETDMYTIHGAGGERDLVLEHGLSQIESEYVKTRIRHLKFRRSFDSAARFAICVFAAAMQARTPKYRDHQSKQWARPLELMQELGAKMASATDEQRERAASINLVKRSENSMGYDQVKQLVDAPLQNLLAPTISTVAPILHAMDFAILVTDDPVGFIASDNPCVWYDPEDYKRQPIFRGPGLGSPTIEVTLPLSPTHCLLLNRHGVSGYADVSLPVVDQLNKRTRAYAEAQIVVHTNATRTQWFEVDPEPEDSWENKRQVTKQEQQNQ